MNSETELQKAIEARERNAQKLEQFQRKLKRTVSEFDALALQHSTAKSELADALRKQREISAEIALMTASHAWRIGSAICYLGRLCTSRKEASFLVFMASVFLGLSRRKRDLRRQARQISRLGLLDVDWYRKNYKRLVGAYVDPVLHYLKNGAKEGCNPNPFFHTKWYSKKYRASIPAGLNPLIHYIRKGAKKTYNPSPLFNTRAYLARHPEISAGSNPLAHFLNQKATTPEVDSPSATVDSSSAESTPKSTSKPRVVYVSAGPKTPGHIYRVEMYANALSKSDYDVHVIDVKDVPHSIKLLETASAIVLWRTVWNKLVEQVYAIAKASGAKVIFDLDDLMIIPELAKADLIDGIRFRNRKESDYANTFAQMRKSAVAADYFTAPTAPLASALRRLPKPGYVLPNGFDEETYLRTRRAVALRRSEPSDGLIRLGYAGGTRTHQKDFACAAASIARILREHPECRLVLFRDQAAKDPLCLDPSEFPELTGLEAQIEWVPYVPLRELPNSISRFDVNLVPLEHGNPFCEAKSELKYFEAALANIPTIASPSVPFATSIRHGETGFLASNSEEWHTTLKLLVTEPQMRAQIGKAAFDDVYWRYGPERRAELVSNMFEQILNGGERESNAFRLELLRAQTPSLPAPRIPEYDVIFESGLRGEAAVAVVVSLFNYGAYVERALESVKAQTLTKRDLIVVDDCSTDDSLRIAEQWIQENKSAFTHIALLRNRVNSGVELTRNAGFSFTDALYVMVLDADDLLLSKCLERCLAEITRTGAAAVYPLIRKFENTQSTVSDREWHPILFANFNYIAATAMIRRSAWARAGGYQLGEVPGGWEDYDLWCRFVELGFRACRVREILALYRDHGKSLLEKINAREVQKRVVEQIRVRHPWVDLPR